MDDIKQFKILGDRLLIKVIKEENDGILSIPDRQKEKPTQGKVISIGDGQVGDKKHSINVQIGDIVMFQKWTNSEIIQEEYMILKYSDIVAAREGGK